MNELDLNIFRQLRNNYTQMAWSDFEHKIFF